MGLFDALDPMIAVPKKLKSACETFAEECKCPPHEIRIHIEFNSKNGDPYYTLWHVGVSPTGSKQWVKKRTVDLSEII
jgi:hypothetical protein